MRNAHGIAARMLLAALMLFSVVRPVGAAELRILHVFDTGPFLCQHGYQDLWVKNPTGRDIRIKATTLWMGMSIGGLADYTATLYAYDRQTDALRLLQFVGWDHYAEPITHSGFRQSFGADWVSLGAGQYLRLLSLCQPFVAGVMGHVGAFIEYVE